MSLLTIGMPVFNDVDFIEESIKSILQQTFADFSLIISDDGSTDGSADICMAYAKQDSRVTYYRQPVNIGISHNMMYLLAQAETKYFMWAGDDDLLDKEFIATLIHPLEKNEALVSSFCMFNEINEKGEIMNIAPLYFDYSGSTADKRLRKFIRDADDRFGYGIFRTGAIRGVEFPVWWWPNRKTPYNNIFPTLGYYLAKGDYVSNNKTTLFYKREKTEKHSNYSYSGKGNAIRETLAFTIRRFNLVLFTTWQIRRAGGVGLAFRMWFPLFYYWFLRSCVHQQKLLLKAFLRKIK